MKEYNRQKSVEYAKKWAYDRNPNYYNFDSVGGDCTSFISQCLLAGGATMNYKKDTGWYYTNGYDKSPSWSGVEYLFNFLIQNKKIGPFAKEVNYKNVDVGDIIQLSFDGIKFSHSTLVVEKNVDIRVATHTYDVFGKKIDDYIFKKARGIHIEGIRNY